MLTESAFAAHIADTIREPLLVLDERFRVLAANRAFFTVFRLDAREILGAGSVERAILLTIADITERLLEMVRTTLDGG